MDYQRREEFDRALEFYEKCLESCKRAENAEMEARCYYKIGLIHEKLGDLERAVVYVNKFLDICKRDGKKRLAGKAHKKLAELNSKLGYASAAIQNLENLLNIAFEDMNKMGQAEAALKLGLLNYKQGLVPTSVTYLTKHFDFARQIKECSLVDAARVNLGIAQANTRIDKYIDMVMNDVNGLLEWKVKRTFKSD